MMMLLKLEHAHTHGCSQSKLEHTLNTHIHTLGLSLGQQQGDIFLAFASQWAVTCCGSLHNSALNVNFWHSYLMIQKENISGKQGEKPTCVWHLYSPKATWKINVTSFRMICLKKKDQISSWIFLLKVNLKNVRKGIFSLCLRIITDRKGWHQQKWEDNEGQSCTLD